jgi:hypothetical protein
MAKHLASRYAPGRRSPSWRKIKPARRLAGVIIGFVPGGTHSAACWWLPLGTSNCVSWPVSAMVLAPGSDAVCRLC